MQHCGIIAPRQHEMIGNEYEIIGAKNEYINECILPRFHKGPHVIKTPEDIYFAWEDDLNCGCCGPEEDQRCYTFFQIKKEDISKLSQKHS